MPLSCFLALVSEAWLLGFPAPTAFFSTLVPEKRGQVPFSSSDAVLLIHVLRENDFIIARRLRREGHADGRRAAWRCRELPESEDSQSVERLFLGEGQDDAIGERSL